MTGLFLQLLALDPLGLFILDCCRYHRFPFLVSNLAVDLSVNCFLYLGRPIVLVFWGLETCDGRFHNKRIVDGYRILT